MKLFIHKLKFYEQPQSLRLYIHVNKSSTQLNTQSHPSQNQLRMNPPSQAQVPQLSTSRHHRHHGSLIRHKRTTPHLEKIPNPITQPQTLNTSSHNRVPRNNCSLRHFLEHLPRIDNLLTTPVEVNQIVTDVDVRVQATLKGVGVQLPAFIKCRRSGTRLDEEGKGKFVGHNATIPHFPKYPEGFKGGSGGGVGSDEDVIGNG
ncbi:hypothetical protein Fmac_017553 [Flemingia macrophylla]|uniref:Uncharacterized protein n=1 Tax=Flemingia macrophylla TaxID=520843 RepID=A0ABD1M2W3_9FABA